jgi:dienelactone hydrolase
MRLLCLFLLSFSVPALAESVYTPAGPEGLAQTAYAPQKGSGPVVIVISGASGLAGELDTFRDCCLIGSMRALEAAAKENGAQFQLVVYPEGRHGFNHPFGNAYRRDYDEDAFKRLREMLDRHQPLAK